MPTVNASLIRDSRNQLGLSVETLATRCKVTTVAMSNIEAGTHNPSYEVCYRLAVQLRISPPDLADVLVDWQDARSIRDRRRVRGLKRSEVAGRAGCSGTHLSNIEAGHKRPSIELRSRLAKVLGCEPDDLEDVPAPVPAAVAA